MTTSPSKKSKEKESLQAQILKKMKYTVFMKVFKVWSNLGPYLNIVIGSKKFGFPAGSMVEVAGKKHSGKTALVMWISGKLQRFFNAYVIWIDAENSLNNENENEDGSFKNAWAAKLGLNTDSDMFYRVYPKILIRQKSGKRGKRVYKKGDSFVQPAEGLFAEAEQVIHWFKKKNPERPIVWVVDSIANLVPEEAQEAGFDNTNMRTNMARSAMLSNSLPKMLTLGANYMIWMFLINQIRTKPGVAFGDPTYTPGGNALDHNCHVQLRMSRSKKFEQDNSKNLTAIGGTIKNIKNKTGGGSVEGASCRYLVRFNRPFKKKMWMFKEVD